MTRKGPDGKTIRPSDGGAGDDDGATRKVQRKSIRDRIANTDDDADAVVTHIAESGAPGGGDDDETAIAGGTEPPAQPAARNPDPAPATARPLSPETTPAHSTPAQSTPVQSTPVSARPGPSVAPSPKPRMAEGDPNVTQVYRPQRPAAETPAGPDDNGIEMADDGTVTDPVVGWLVVIEGPGRGSALPIGYGNNRLGRGSTEQICLDFGDEQISRENHAVVTYDGRHRKFYVQQGGGRNLTHVDDELVMVPVEVKGGETISLGRTKLRFVPFCGQDFDWQDQ